MIKKTLTAVCRPLSALLAVPASCLIFSSLHPHLTQTTASSNTSAPQCVQYFIILPPRVFWKVQRVCLKIRTQLSARSVFLQIVLIDIIPSFTRRLQYVAFFVGKRSWTENDPTAEGLYSRFSLWSSTYLHRK